MKKWKQPELAKQKIWMDMLTRVLAGEKNIASPFASDGQIESIFIIVNKDAKLGWGLVWCSKTHRGVRLSRMEVPDTVESVFGEENNNFDHVPAIKFESL